MPNIQVKTLVPGIREATKLMVKIKRASIHDVELMFNDQTGLWGVVQVFKTPSRRLMLNSTQAQSTGPLVMFWIRNPDGSYRSPSEQDLNDTLAIVTRAQVTFTKGSDWLVEKAEKAEKATHDENRRKQSERIRSFAKPLKKALREGRL